ncbi:hypothetical protein B0F90DRAFT_1723728 [Multifurca ochricompacta]|uniref:Uncharacterized protein n=1 Tax=Multifurca ochricompacta TaxID=376703 RepID=A0AAD4M3Y4_9AGAM|nr:hypothetical protein B0F90DRAFT_1723728 [Multifurca ochricompacta]
MDLPTSSPVHRSRNVLYQRGSVSASDPFGIHAEQNLSDERALMSRLTIVRVVPEENQDREGHRFDSTSGTPEPRRNNWSPTTSPSLHLRSGQTGQSRRLSFASSSFAHESLSPPVAPISPPSYANRKRRPSTSLYAQRTSLSPQQLCDLAQSSVQPRPLLKSDVSETSSSPRSPLHSHSSSSFNSLTTANFLPLPDGQFLPFLDRPTEVLEFISTSPTNRLMALLEQAFPAHLRRQRHRTEDIQLPLPSIYISDFDPQLPVKQRYRDSPPHAWSYETLLEWMSTVSRSEAGDAAWVRAIRACVMARSEQICVTLLAALGVPMEGGADLDVVSLPIGMPDADLVLPELFTTFAGGPLSQLPTLPEAPSNESEDAFQLEILPITFESTELVTKSDPQRCSPSGSTSSWSPSSRSSSRLSTTMESIGESDSEQEGETTAESVPTESEFLVSDEHLPGEVTARAGSPVGTNAAKPLERITVPDPLSAMTEQWENDQLADGDRWRMAWEQVENCYGLSISTCARLAADPSLPSSVPQSAMPHAVASPVRPKQRRNTVQVSHVLSGAPGYEGFTWRPGGPLFPMSFTGAASSGEGFSMGGNSDSFMTSNPVLKPRSRSRSKVSGSRSKASVKSPLTPPNSPVTFLV